MTDLDKYADEKVAVGSTSVEPVSESSEGSVFEIDPVVEKRMIRKIDLNLVTLFSVVYAFSYLDRANIGNANLTGFSTDLGLVGNQFGAATSVVYATYVIFEPVYAVLLKIISPRILLTITTLCWSSLTIGGAFIKNYDQLIAVRVLLGATEAGMIPCALLYLTMTYNREEVMLRDSLIFLGSALSGAFGGLLAYGLSQVHAAGMHGWQWLYLVEGLISFCLAPVIAFWLPNSVKEAKFLTQEERELFARRQALQKHVYNDEEKFTWAAVRSAFAEPRVYIHAVAHYGIDCTLYSLTTFMPKIVAGLGFTTTTTAQLLTVPVYVIAAGSFIAAAYLSDKFKRRGVFVIGGLCCNLLGYIILATAASPGARYAAVFIAAIGLYIPTGMHVLWTGGNFAGHYKRALCMGLVQLVGNSSGATVGFVFTTQTAPRYFKGLYFDIGMTALSIICTSVNLYLIKRINQRKQAAVDDGAANQPELGDKNPHFFLFH
ncbi:High-affinity nicotinic acid transporter [Cryptotrichosporon argae]